MMTSLDDALDHDKLGFRTDMSRDVDHVSEKLRDEFALLRTNWEKRFAHLHPDAFRPEARRFFDEVKLETYGSFAEIFCRCLVANPLDTNPFEGTTRSARQRDEAVRIEAPL